MAREPAGPPTETPDSLGIVGRAREWDTLNNAVQRMLLGNGGVVLVHGEAGIGKTALVTTVAETARHSGALTLTGYCYDLTSTPPYGPWIQIADSYPSYDDLPALPEVLRSGTDMGTISNQIEFFDVIREFLLSVAARRPLLLVLEDLHWSDSASLDLLRFLARHVSARRTLMIATYRDDELSRGDLLFERLPSIVRESDAQRVHLLPLAESAVRTLVDARYHLVQPDADRLTDYLLKHSDANPLFLRELLHTLEEQRVLQHHESGWSLQALGRLQIPPLLNQVIEARVGRTGEATREALQIAAVIGQEVALDLWRRISLEKHQDFDDLVAQTVESHLMVEAPDSSSFSFTHALVREVLHKSVPLPQRRSIHLEIAEELMSDVSPDPDTVAYHLEQAGDARAVDWLLQAGNRALRSYAWLTAAERFDAALQHMEHRNDDEARRGWLCYRLGRLWRFAAPHRGIEYLDRAEEYARLANDGVLAKFTLADRALLRVYGGDIARGIDEMLQGDRALESLYAVNVKLAPETVASITDTFFLDPKSDNDANGLTLPEINTRRGALVCRLAMAGRLDEAEDLGRAFVEQFHALEDPSDMVLSSYADVLLGFSVIHATRGRPAEAREAIAEAREIYLQLRHLVLLAHSPLFELDDIVLPYYATNLHERRRLLDLSTHWSRKAEGAINVLPSDQHVYMLQDLVLRGEWALATELALPNVNSYRSDRHTSAVPVLTQLAREQDDHDRAWQLIHLILRDGPNTEPGDSRFPHAVVLLQLAANLALDSGNLESARAWIEACDRWLEWSGAVRGRSESLLLWSRYHHENGNSTRALEFAHMAIAHATNPEQPLALLSAHRFVGGLYSEQGSFGTSAEHLSRSLEISDACAAPYERALTLLAMAELYVESDERDTAQTLLDEVRSVCAPLGARLALNRAEQLASTLTGRQKKDQFPAGLTSREIEVLRLIAQGMSDKDIAEALFISHHTVMRHVSHILAKLAVESRAAAAAAAVRLGLA